MKVNKWIEPGALFLDFEFNCTTHEEVNLVSCVTHDTKTKKTRKFWLHRSPQEQDKLRKHLEQYQVIIGYACVAEARSFYALNLDPLQFKWIDLFLEYRMLSNHNDKLNYGKQLVDGKVKTVQKPKPKWERTEQDSKTGFKPTHSLAEATFKLTGQIRDTKEKDECRKLILSNPKRFTEEERERILAYNAEDVEFLPNLWEAMKIEYEELMAAHNQDLDWEEYWEEALWRGRYSAHTAIMESIGYPINYDATKNFSRQIPAILSECQADINEQFKPGGIAEVAARLKGEEFMPIMPFKWHPKTATYSWNQKATREWLKFHGYHHDWMETDGGQLSLSLEAFEQKFQYKHDYQAGNFGAQMVRFLKLKQSLYGFADSQGGKRKSFWDSVGPDKRVRPYMNIYGAQSGRSQPAATGFMFLKPAWMRALVQPADGYFLAGIDYGQQEFFLAALLSEDEKMVEAYLSGDPYLFMAKEAGVIPPEGTKETHARERDLMKSTTLGILYMMTKYGLSDKLTADSGEYYSEEQAQDLIDTFESLFPVFTDWRQNLIAAYEEYKEPITTLDGWKIWSDNDNPRSVGNVPVQGAGASCMRGAVDYAVAAGCRVIFTLHDAIYIEGKIGQEDHIVRLHKAMRKGFAEHFEGTRFEEAAKKIKLDPKAWGNHFPDKGEITVGGIKVPVSKIHIDPRALSDYNKFSKYFSQPEGDFL